MDDQELQAIRAARLKELQNSQGQGGGQAAQPTGLNPAMDEVLELPARERLARVHLVRPDRAKAVEQFIMRMVQTGQIRKKLSEEDIVQILNGIARDEQKKNDTKIVFSRKQTSLSDDEDDDDFFD